jgi:thiol-disulfide isomerase/thioredoxin
MQTCPRTRTRWWAVALVAVAGCTQSGTQSSESAVSDQAQKSATPRKAESALPTTAVTPTIEILSWEQTQKRREQWKGKVVVLDIWSTFCQPCVREFPNLVKLQEQFGEKVACVSFNTDYTGAKDEPPESFRKNVLAFLTTQKAQLFNVLSSDANEEFYDKIRLGGPPAVFVYDRDGKLAKRFDNSQVPKVPEFTYKSDVIPLVEHLLTQSDAGRR